MAEIAAKAKDEALTIGIVHYSDYLIDSRIQRQAQALASRGDSVHCICIGDRPGVQRHEGRGAIRTHALRCPKPRAGARSYLAAYLRFFLKALATTFRLDRKLRFDLVQVANMPNFLTFAAAGPRLRSVPLILDMHDTFPELFSDTFGVSSQSLVSRLVYGEERWSSRIADRLV